MLKTLTFLMTISLALFCLSSCSDSKPSESSETPEESLIRQCKEHVSKPLVAEEVENFAILTNSKGKTYIHLDGIGGYCDSSIKIRTSLAEDTLKLEEYWPEDGLNYNSKCSCISSLDLTIESVGDGVKYLLYSYVDAGGAQDIFSVLYK